MKSRHIVLAAMLSAFPLAAQKPVPRAADGHPDLSGIWTNVTLTPLERPAELAGKEFFAEQEARDFEKSHIKNYDDRDKIKGTDADLFSGYNDLWWDSGTKVVKTLRTSIVVDPADGRIPALTPERQAQSRALAEARRKRCLQPGCGLENSGQLAPAEFKGR